MTQSVVLTSQNHQPTMIQSLSSAERVALENNLRTNLNSQEQRFAYAYVYFGGLSTRSLEFCGNPRQIQVNKYLDNKCVQEYIEILQVKKEFADAELYKKEKSILDYRKKVEMLWRIAEDNERLDPRLSIASIMELNRMQGHSIFNASPTSDKSPVPALLKAVVDKASTAIDKIRDY